jgi:addiction module HigA family antidote
MKPSHPGAFIREEIFDELGLSVSAAARALDVQQDDLDAVVAGNAPLSAELAQRIERTYGVKSAMLLAMQVWYDSRAVQRPR